MEITFWNSIAIWVFFTFPEIKGILHGVLIGAFWSPFLVVSLVSLDDWRELNL